MRGIILENGVVVARGVITPNAERAAILDEASRRAADESLDLTIREQAQRLLDEVEPSPEFHAGAWDESVVGQPPAWPRAERNRRLIATDYVELPGWRKSQSEEHIEAKEAERQALRDLPETCPDPLAVVWP